MKGKQHTLYQEILSNCWHDQLEVLLKSALKWLWSISTLPQIPSPHLLLLHSHVSYYDVYSSVTGTDCLQLQVHKIKAVMLLFHSIFII